jgi:hypothetical protein
LGQRRGFDSEDDVALSFLAALKGIANEPNERKRCNYYALDYEALMKAYEARYGKETADKERRYLESGWRNSARIHVLQQALTSSDWKARKEPEKGTDRLAKGTEWR